MTSCAARSAERSRPTRRPQPTAPWNMLPNIPLRRYGTTRKLDFLIQEINRECNTIGSKCSDLTITQDVVNMKAEVEKIREQVQNIE